MRVILAARRADTHSSSPRAEEPAGDREWTTRWFQPGRREAALARLGLAQKDSGTPLSAEHRDLRGIQLVGQNLAGLDLSDADLSFANLSQSDLTGARLTGARLHGASLFGANLTECEFLNADLSQADLSECTAYRAGFGNAQLCGAKLFHTDASGATFTKAILRGVDARAATLAQARLLETDLTDADFSRSMMSASDLTRSVVQGTSFQDADLSRSRLSGIRGHVTADWIGADIANVDFCGAYLVRRTIEDQNYLHEFRTQNALAAWVYRIWWITSDCGRSFARWGLWTLLIVAMFAGLYEVVDVDYGEHRTSLSSLYYSVVTLTTLGYGDVLPASAAAQLVAMSQVIIGYVMLGGLLSIFSNKMARRAS